MRSFPVTDVVRPTPSLTDLGAPTVWSVSLPQAETAELGDVAGMQIGDDQGQLLTMLVRPIGARRAVEVGDVHRLLEHVYRPGPGRGRFPAVLRRQRGVEARSASDVTGWQRISGKTFDAWSPETASSSGVAWSNPVCEASVGCQVRATGLLDRSTPPVDRGAGDAPGVGTRRHARLDMSRVTVSDAGCLPALVRVCCCRRISP